MGATPYSVPDPISFNVRSAVDLSVSLPGGFELALSVACEITEIRTFRFGIADRCWRCHESTSTA